MLAKMARWLLVIPLLFCLSAVHAIEIKKDAPEVYVVKEGDTLWDIASLYLEQPWQWPQLWRTNTHITNPHLIYPGDELRIRFDDQGNPVVEVVRERPKNQIKLSPQGRKQIKAPDPIPALPWDLIRPYVEKALVMSEEDYQRLPYLLGNHEGAVRFATDDLVLSKTTRRPAEHYQVIREQNVLKDEFDNVLGVLVRHVADATPLEDDLGNEVLVRVEQANFEAKRGDKLLPDEPITAQVLELKAADRARGRIIDSLEQHGLLGKFDVVVLDVGERDVSAGAVMGIYLQGPAIYDSEDPLYETENNPLRSAFFGGNEVQQPALKVGELVVFRVFEKASYGLITRSTKVIKNGAIVANP